MWQKLSTHLFLVPTSGHLFTYRTSETAALLLDKQWFATAELLPAPGGEQICEAVDTECLICLSSEIVREAFAYGMTPTVGMVLLEVIVNNKSIS